MEPQDSNILWNKQEQANPPSENGPNGIDSGSVTRPVGKFGNMGYYDDAGDQTAFGTVPGFNSNEFCIEGQLKLDYNVVNGVPSNGAYNNIFTFYYSATHYIYNAFYPSGTRAVIRVNSSSRYSDRTDAGIDLIAGTFYHWLLAYSQSKTWGDGNQIRYYLDGSLVANFNVSAVVCPVATHPVVIGGRAAWSERLNGGFDNLKLYPGASLALINAIIANKDNEGWLISYIIPNKFNRIAGLNQGRSL